MAMERWINNNTHNTATAKTIILNKRRKKMQCNRCKRTRHNVTRKHKNTQLAYIKQTDVAAAEVLARITIKIHAQLSRINWLNIKPCEKHQLKQYKICKLKKKTNK